MGDTPLPTREKRNIKAVASSVAMGAVKYVIYVVVVVGSLAAVFYTSQAAQDADRARVAQQVSVNATDIRSLQKCSDQTAGMLESTKRDLGKTREELTKIATLQESMSTAQQTLSSEQTKLNDKMDDLKTILIRMEKSQ